jgi:hypothetical protein
MMHVSGHRSSAYQIKCLAQKMSDLESSTSSNSELRSQFGKWPRGRLGSGLSSSIDTFWMKVGQYILSWSILQIPLGNGVVMSTFILR